MWHFIHEGVEFGPMDDGELCNAASTGLLFPTDEVRNDDIEEPFLAADVDGLFDDIDTSSGSGQDYDDVDSPDSASFYQSDVVGSGKVVCVHCWYRFEPEDTLSISRHPDLASDPILGEGEQQRFLPSRFTPEGHAIDSEGLVCPEIACPKCHMRLPRSLLNMRPMFLSLVGAPGSGKSYFLASMSWKLRTTLPEKFLVNFTDADGVTNHWLTDYEERLFVQAEEDSLQSIDKTQLRGDLYKEVMLNGMRTSLPMPAIFTLQADESSIFHSEQDHYVNRSLILYDNAGEHFEPGRDSAADPGTQHLLHASSLLFMLDPTKSPAFRKALTENEDPQLKRSAIVQRQDVVFTETLNRIRLHMGLEESEQYKNPVVVLLSKSDLFGGEIDEILDSEPWRWNEDWQTYCLDVSHIMQASFHIRHFISKYAPELVRAVEAFASDVVYMPVSALGCSPIPDPEHKGDPEAALLVVRSGDIKPKWVEVPLLYALFRKGYIGGVSKGDPNHPVPEKYDIRGGMFHFIAPGTTNRVRIPVSYASYSLKDPDTQTWFTVPDNH